MGAGHLEATQFRGVTTNPSLSLAAVLDDPDRWAHLIWDSRAANHM
ncbi:MAG TPA: hypothetical protein VIK32_14670 [Candidatus Limnocylindrales bacterium]